MPGLVVIVLDTPFAYSPGHGHPVESYPHVFLRKFSYESAHRCMFLEFQYGTVSNGIWVAGDASDEAVVIENHPAQIDPHNPENSIAADPAFDVLIGTTMIDQSHVGQQLYLVVATNLYQRAIDDGHYQGTPQYVE